ncbi:type II toxin-antitoxin system RelE/ParE family toxin [Roseivirga echinicomitans]|uniref:type II toxin-antitoxin system RelE/ParE family toxin n=1 Tax=Roseivirga echinicomitans TaxID=296218 RepID=UPI0009FC3F88
MSYSVIIKPQTENDITEAALWYEFKRSGLGARFLISLDHKLTLIQKRPYLFQERYKNVRFALIKQYPFAIHYFIDDKRIFVIAVLSTSRNPKIWETR